MQIADPPIACLLANTSETPYTKTQIPIIMLHNSYQYAKISLRCSYTYLKQVVIKLQYTNVISVKVDDELHTRLKYNAGILEMPVSAFIRLILRHGIDIVIPTLLGERWAFINQAYKDELQVPKPQGKIVV